MTSGNKAGGKSAGALYLQQARERLEGLKKSLGELVDLSRKMAEPLLAGGALFTPPTTSWFGSEYGGRAGGFMGLHSADYVPQSDKDVAFCALPDPRRATTSATELLEKLAASPAQLFVVGTPAELPKSLHKRIAGFTGGDVSTQGEYSFGEFSPLVGFRAFEQFARMWMTTGELIAACICAGKMPMIWMSVWLEGAFVRNASFMKHNNTQEPWSYPMFHENRYIPPLEPGYVGQAFLAALTAVHGRLESQLPVLEQAGAWMAAAHRGGHKVHAMAVGHAYPNILEITEPERYPIRWWPPMSDLNRAVPMEIGEDEVVLHLGYAPVDTGDVGRIVDRGVKLIYTSPYGRPAGLKDHPNLLWFDLPWRPTDATVDIPGYSVRILPMSSSAQALAYNAMMAEFAQAMQWRAK